MSKRYVARQEHTATTDTATDPGRIIQHFLPQLRAHVINEYDWISERGHCMLDRDDLIQVASIELMRLAEKWADIVDEHPDFVPGTDGTYDAIFYAFLKRSVKSRLLKSKRETDHRPQSEALTVELEGKAFERRELYEYSEGELHDRTGVRRRPDGPWWGAIVDEIMSFWDEMAPKYKVAIALRHYDELAGDRMMELTGISRSLADRTIKEWRAHAKNRVRLGDDEEAISRTMGKPWEPPELLTEYLRNRHRMDIHEYLGIVTISFRTDPDYLVRVLDVAPVSIARKSQITDEQIAIIERMAAEGCTNYSEIGRAAGVSSVGVRYRLNPDARAAARNRRLGQRTA